LGLFEVVMVKVNQVIFLAIFFQEMSLVLFLEVTKSQEIFFQVSVLGEIFHLMTF